MTNMYQETALRIFQDLVSKNEISNLNSKQGISDGTAERLETFAKNAWEAAKIFIDNAPND